MIRASSRKGLQRERDLRETFVKHAHVNNFPHVSASCPKVMHSSCFGYSKKYSTPGKIGDAHKSGPEGAVTPDPGPDH